jgi:ribosomal 30S subunit maturation factor RimM
VAQAAVNRTEPVSGRFKAPAEYVKYWVCDPEGRRIGRVKEVFTNEYGEPEYLRVRMGLFGRKTVLIPVGGFVTVDEERRTFTLQ